MRALASSSGAKHISAGHQGSRETGDTVGGTGRPRNMNRFFGTASKTKTNYNLYRLCLACGDTAWDANAQRGPPDPLAQSHAVEGVNRMDRLPAAENFLFIGTQMQLLKECTEGTNDIMARS